MRPYAIGFSQCINITHNQSLYPLRFHRKHNFRRIKTSSSCVSNVSGFTSALNVGLDRFNEKLGPFNGIQDDSILLEEELLKRDEHLKFATSYHAPVMAKECIDALLVQKALDDPFQEDMVLSENQKRKLRYAKMKDNKDWSSSTRLDEQDTVPIQKGLLSQRPRLFIDGTLGGGGHSQYLLQSLEKNDILIGCDVDDDALSTASKRLSSYMQGDPSLPLFLPVRSNFRDLAENLSCLSHPSTGQPILKSSKSALRSRDQHDPPLFPHGADGLLLDLGVSSYQIDNPQRGFTYNRDGPLDMRMSTESLTLTAADICNEFSEEQLIDIFKRYGDEPRSRSIAQSIAQRRPLSTTMDLVNAIAAVTPSFSKSSRRMGRTATCARVFQSLRIVVNQEEEALLKVLLKAAPSLVRRGDGRLVVLTYHSLEDRAVKRAIRDGGMPTSSSNTRDAFGNMINEDNKPWSMVGKKLKASEDEVQVNSRARSATLRVAIRL